MIHIFFLKQNGQAFLCKFSFKIFVESELPVSLCCTGVVVDESGALILVGGYSSDEKHVVRFFVPSFRNYILQNMFFFSIINTLVHFFLLSTRLKTCY